MSQAACADGAPKQGGEPVIRPESREQLKTFLKKDLDYSVPDGRGLQENNLFTLLLWGYIIRAGRVGHDVTGIVTRLRHGQ